ncbi:hypothetical protein [Sporosarcina highlanderae]|uniref:Uncharacterized protein n=1 Tax=Sporosarcina highlanderae TaxID=3035916 RepID=A0ABT8JW37_9BACL|nr:hypothetical protein [Sporosarcina highlanderae]MDN4609147.1 hypothetical protein [Sporosarcina highlanderae]
MELQSIVSELYETRNRLKAAEKEVYRLGDEAARAEYAYREALSKEHLILKTEGMPVTIIGDISRGNVAGLKFERDKAANRFRSGFSAMDAIKVEINALQSILRIQTDI